MGLKTSGKVAMIHIAVDWLLSWLMRKGGLLISIEVEDVKD